jgi:hypothetical protein
VTEAFRSHFENLKRRDYLAGPGVDEWLALSGYKINVQ